MTLGAAPLNPDARQRKRSRAAWQSLLLLPYLGLCFPSLFARSTPAVLGFPFFYWYQFAWVGLSSLLMAVVYRKMRS